MKLSHCFVEIPSVPTDLSFAISSNIVVVGTFSGKLEILDLEDDDIKVKSSLDVGLSTQDRDLVPSTVDFMLDGSDRLVCSMNDGSGAIYDLRCEGILRDIKRLSKSENPANCAVIIDEQRFAFGLDDGIIQVWDSRKEDSILTVKVGKSESEITDIIVDSAKRTLLCTLDAGGLATLSLRNRKIFDNLESYQDANVSFTALRSFKDETKLVVGDDSGRFYAYDWGNYVSHCDDFRPRRCGVNAIAGITEEIGIVGYDDGSVRAIQFFPNKQLKVLGRHDSMVTAMDVSGDGEFLATIAHEEQVRFWYLRSLEDTDTTVIKDCGKLSAETNTSKSTNKQNAKTFYQGLTDT